MFVQTAEQARRFFIDVHRKVGDATPLTSLETLVADVIALHPEWHALLADPERALALDAPMDPFANPFLHLSMHVALAEQIGADRPQGIQALMQGASARTDDPHRLAHLAIEVLIESLAEAGALGGAPDEGRYLERLRSRLSGPGFR